MHVEFLMPVEFLLCMEEKLETEVRPLCSQVIYVSVLDKCSISLAVIVKGMSVRGWRVCEGHFPAFLPFIIVTKA